MQFHNKLKKKSLDTAVLETQDEGTSISHQDVKDSRRADRRLSDTDLEWAG